MDESFWESMCTLFPFFRVVFLISVALSIPTLGVLLLLEAGTSSYVVSLLTLSITVPLALLSGLLLRKCVDDSDLRPESRIE